MLLTMRAEVLRQPSMLDWIKHIKSRRIALTLHHSVKICEAHELVILLGQHKVLRSNSGLALR